MKKIIRGGNMNKEDRQLIVETLGEMRELKGEMREFKLHVIGRVEKLESKEGESKKNRYSIIAIIISAAAFISSLIINLFKGKL
jgi:hypothetical protein